ncbi:hypothetical protein F5884DRAFT_693424 [Xylogone sp. PMI_703]|nr:hypothetical protein F5884DRAFT_693424 [Xylogone sp. PMI_703]
MAGHRRAHKKSRYGCTQCKERKIKCDETKPACSNCVRHSATCIYRLAPPSTPSPSSIALNGNSPVRIARTASPSIQILPPIRSSVYIPIGDGFGVSDFELLHHFTTSTSLTMCHISKRQKVWQNLVPQIAFSHHFLLHGIFAISALHIARLQPSRSESLHSQAALHHQNSLSLFRTTISSITPANCDACFAFSATLAIYHWTSTGGKGNLFFSDSIDGITTVEWVKVLRGLLILKSAWHWINDGPLKPLLKLAPDGVGPDQLRPEDKERFEALRQLWSAGSTELTIEDVASLNEALDLLQELYGYITSAHEDISFTAMAFSWPVKVSNHYIELIHRRLPAALILLAHFCLLLNKIDNFWWNKGMSRHLLQTVHQTLGREWENWISWPLQALVLAEFENSAKEII